MRSAILMVLIILASPVAALADPDVLLTRASRAHGTTGDVINEDAVMELAIEAPDVARPLLLRQARGRDVRLAALASYLLLTSKKIALDEPTRLSLVNQMVATSESRTAPGYARMRAIYALSLSSWPTKGKWTLHILADPRADDIVDGYLQFCGASQVGSIPGICDSIREAALNEGDVPALISVVEHWRGRVVVAAAAHLARLRAIVSVPAMKAALSRGVGDADLDELVESILRLDGFSQTEVVNGLEAAVRSLPSDRSVRPRSITWVVRNDRRVNVRIFIVSCMSTATSPKIIKAVHDRALAFAAADPSIAEEMQHLVCGLPGRASEQYLLDRVFGPSVTASPQDAGGAAHGRFPINDGPPTWVIDIALRRRKILRSEFSGRLQAEQAVHGWRRGVAALLLGEAETRQVLVGEDRAAQSAVLRATLTTLWWPILGRSDFIAAEAHEELSKERLTLPVDDITPLLRIPSLRKDAQLYLTVDDRPAARRALGPTCPVVGFFPPPFAPYKLQKKYCRETMDGQREVLVLADGDLLSVATFVGTTITLERRRWEEPHVWPDSYAWPGFRWNGEFPLVTKPQVPLHGSLRVEALRVAELQRALGARLLFFDAVRVDQCAPRL